MNGCEGCFGSPLAMRVRLLFAGDLIELLEYRVELVVKVLQAIQIVLDLQDGLAPLGSELSGHACFRSASIVSNGKVHHRGTRRVDGTLVIRLKRFLVLQELADIEVDKPKPLAFIPLRHYILREKRIRWPPRLEQSAAVASRRPSN